MAISNTSTILEDTVLLATVPEPVSATWALETGVCPGTIVLRAFGPVVASSSPRNIGRYCSKPLLRG